MTTPKMSISVEGQELIVRVDLERSPRVARARELLNRAISLNDDLTARASMTLLLSAIAEVVPDVETMTRELEEADAGSPRIVLH